MSLLAQAALFAAGAFITASPVPAGRWRSVVVTITAIGGIVFVWVFGSLMLFKLSSYGTDHAWSYLVTFLPDFMITPLVVVAGSGLVLALAMPGLIAALLVGPVGRPTCVRPIPGGP